MSGKPGVFVTGGSGFVGGRLIERLRAEGHPVRALARSDRAAARVRGLDADVVPGDISSVAAMTAGAEGCAWAFHAAANTHEWDPLEDYQRDNVDGTRNTLEACAQAGVRRFVHVGTDSVLLTGKPLVNVDETAPLRTDSPVRYGASKARAEQLVIAANREGFETVSVRPRWVWGVGDTVVLPRLVEKVRAGHFAWYGGGQQLMSTTHVDNTVEGLMLAATRGVPGSAYFVTDGAPVVFRDFVSEQLQTQGVDPPTRNRPRLLVGAVAWVGDTLWRSLPLPGSPPMTLFYYWIFSQEGTLNDAKAQRELGYRPVKTREEGMAELRTAATGGAPTASS